MMHFFQQSPSQQSKRARARLEDALAMILQNCSEGDFTRLFDSIDELAFVDPMFYQALRGQYLTKSLFDAVSAEDEYRQSRPMHERVRL